MTRARSCAAWLSAAVFIFGANAFAQQQPAPMPPPAPSAAPVPAQAPAPAEAVVVVGDTGGLPPQEVDAVRNLAMNELVARGISVSSDPRFGGAHPVDAQLQAAVRGVGANRLFVLDAQGRLGAKIPFRFRELSPVDLRTLASAALSAESIEEADRVIPRLVDAVLDRQPVSETQQIDNLSAGETQPFLKKPGETFFYLGLNIPIFGSGEGGLYGYSVGYMYEATDWRLGGVLEGAGRDDRSIFFIGLDGAWLPLEGSWTPYVDGGLGFVAESQGEGVGAKIEAGVEALRLHHVRLMIGLNLHIPFFHATQIIYPMLALRFGF